MGGESATPRLDALESRLRKMAETVQELAVPRCAFCRGKLAQAHKYPPGWMCCDRHFDRLQFLADGKPPIFVDRWSNRARKLRVEALAISRQKVRDAPPSRRRLCKRCGEPMSRVRICGHDGKPGRMKAVCLEPTCVKPKRWCAPLYRWNDIFPRRELDNHSGEDDPGFENVVRVLEDSA